MVVGFAIRVNHLGSESYGEDELNKLQTVGEYRNNGLSGKNGEHPFLMKGLQTLSISASEKLNSVISRPTPLISEEAALRFPLVLFGTFTILLLFLLVRELFGRSIAILSAALWALEPMAIGFDRIAKEDSLVLFFFLLTNFFWVRSQTEAEHRNTNWTWYAWAAAAGFAGLMASKYYPFLLGMTAAYYIIYRDVPNRYWEMQKVRWLKFLIVMGISFLILNPTILLPDAWREMAKFSSEGRIGHDSYEYFGRLYHHQATAWLAGVPWTFYFVFIGVKTSLTTLILAIVGVPLLVRSRLGDGRFFILFWAVFWLISFTFSGGKFTRYFTTAAPLVFVAAATAFYFLIKWVASRIHGDRLSAAFQIGMFAIFLTVPLSNSLSSAPHFRLFTNLIGGGPAAAGAYFPHDEFYDATTREAVSEIAASARPGALVACETPAVFEYYAAKAGRSDLQFVSLSDKTKVLMLNEGDLVVSARGRRYFSNTPYLELLERSNLSPIDVHIEMVSSAKVYKLDQATVEALKLVANRS